MWHMKRIQLQQLLSVDRDPHEGKADLKGVEDALDTGRQVLDLNLAQTVAQTDRDHTAVPEPPEVM